MDHLSARLFCSGRTLSPSDDDDLIGDMQGTRAHMSVWQPEQASEQARGELLLLFPESGGITGHTVVLLHSASIEVENNRARRQIINGP